MNGKDVIYKGEKLTLTRFWGNNELCLWICNAKQINLPKMEFVGGYANDYCIFIKNLTEAELQQITFIDGVPININALADVI